MVNALSDPSKQSEATTVHRESDRAISTDSSNVMQSVPVLLTKGPLSDHKVDFKVDLVLGPS